MNLIKVNKRKKYLNVFDLWSCIDTKDHVDFVIDRYITNKTKKCNMMVLTFTHNGLIIKDRAFLSRIHDHIQNSYPKALVQDITIQCQYAPEIVKSYIAVSSAF